MQVIEKVNVVPEGYNGAGMNYDGCNRRDVNGKANACLLYTSNIGDYKDFLDIITSFINDFVINVFNNINNYPKLVEIITVSYTHLDVYKRQV